jgi:hypothetical protein
MSDTVQLATQFMAARDSMLAALNAAQSVILNEIAATTVAGQYLSRLVDRRNAIAGEQQQVIDAANAAVLNLPAIQAAVTNLNALATSATTAAGQMKAATDKITQATNVLNFAQQFTDLITQKPPAG